MDLQDTGLAVAGNTRNLPLFRRQLAHQRGHRRTTIRNLRIAHHPPEKAREKTTCPLYKYTTYARKKPQIVKNTNEKIVFHAETYANDFPPYAIHQPPGRCHIHGHRRGRRVPVAAVLTAAVSRHWIAHAPPPEKVVRL